MKETLMIIGTVVILAVGAIGLILGLKEGLHQFDKWRYPHREVICTYPNGGFLKVPEEAVEYAWVARGTTYINLHAGGQLVSTLDCTIGKKAR